MLPQLREMGADWLYFHVELPLCRVLAEMEAAGFRVDAGALRSFGETLSAALGELEQKIYSYAGKFNINSPKQERSSLKSWACPLIRRPKPATPPTRRSSTSSGERTPLWERYWSTGSTPSSRAPMWTDC